MDGLRKAVPNSVDARVDVAESDGLPEASGSRTTRAEATYFVVPVQASIKSPERIIPLSQQHPLLISPKFPLRVELPVTFLEIA